MVPEDQGDLKNLFKTLYSEYAGEDRLFDTNRLYTVQERDPDLDPPLVEGVHPRRQLALGAPFLFRHGYLLLGNSIASSRRWG